MSIFRTSPKEWITSVGVIAALFVLIITGLRHTTPPEPAALDAAVTSFSSARAMEHLRVIAKSPHSLGTAEDEQVRQYLQNNLRAMGFDPQIQTAWGLNTNRWNVGLTHNVIVHIPGRVPSKAVMLVAHYDSVPYGPGAADDGASVAAILETLRALKTQMPLQNDLICLFTDGEEMGMLGADAFMAQSPFAGKVGLALNFEYRGNGGPVLMFETNEGNARIITDFAQSVPHPMATSLMYEVYKLLPNDTDFTVFRRGGIQGLNFAAIQGIDAYHTSLDRVDLLSQDTLQHEGETMLALVRQVGAAPLDAVRPGDSVYFDLPCLGLVHYPSEWRWPLSLLVLLLCAGVLRLGFMRGQLRMGRVLWGSLGFLLTAILLSAISLALWFAVLMLYPWYRTMPDPDPGLVYLCAFVLFTIGAFVFTQLALRRWLRPLESALGAGLCWLLLLLVTDLRMPGVSFLFTWPLIPVLLSLLGLLSAWGQRLSEGAKAWILLAGIAPGVLIFAPLVRLLYLALTPNMLFVPVLVLLLLLGIMALLLDLIMRRPLLIVMPIAVCALFAAAGYASSHVDQGDMHPEHLIYAYDEASGKALWLSIDDVLGEQAKTLFAEKPVKRKVPEIFGDAPWPMWASPAPVLDVRAPAIELLEDRLVQNAREIRVRVKSQEHAPYTQILVQGSDVLSSTVQGRPFSDTPRAGWMLNAYGTGEEGVEINLRLAAGKPFRIRAFDNSYSLPENTPHRDSVQLSRMNILTEAISTKEFE